MDQEGMLVLAMALPPMWLAGQLWWYVTHTGSDLSEHLNAAAKGQQGVAEKDW